MKHVNGRLIDPKRLKQAICHNAMLLVAKYITLNFICFDFSKNLKLKQEIDFFLKNPSNVYKSNIAS